MKKVLSIFLVLILALSIVACNRDKEETDTGNDNNDVNQGTDNEKEEEEEVVIEPSGHIIVGNANFNGDFINGWGNSSYDNNVRKLVFGGASTAVAGLLTTDQEGQVVLNSITESREISDDALVHTFTLKPDLVYSDGTPLNADDVVFTYEFYLDSDAMIAAAGSSALNQFVEKVEKLDDLTIQFTMKERFYTVDNNFFQHILSKEWAMDGKPDDVSVQQHVRDNLVSSPIGYGPYVITEYEENQFVKLTVNELYIGNFEGQKPMIKDIIIKVVSNETDIDELLTANIDILAGVVESEKIDAAKDDPGFSYSNYPRHGYGYLNFHSDFGVVRSKAVRQAIAYTIDREVFRNAFLGKYGMSTDGPYSTNYWMIDEEWVDANLIKYTADLDKVNEILTADGWARGDDGIWAKDGERLEIELLAPLQRWADTLNLTLAKTGEEFGIKFNIEVLDFSVLLDHFYGQNISDINERKYHMFALATSLQIIFDGYANWHSDKVVQPWGAAISTNSARFENARNDELLMIMRTAESDEIFKNAYRDWVILMNEYMPTIPLYSNDYHDLYNARIKGFETNALWDWVPAILYSTVE